MSRERIYLIVGTGGLLLLLLYLFFGPVDQEEGQALLWEKDWVRIEYYTYEEDAEKEREPRLRLRLIREGGLLEHSFFVESPREENPDAPPVRRKGGGNVKNIFRDWARPPLKGIYKREAVKPEQSGLDAPGEMVRLYHTEDSEPVTLLLGRTVNRSTLFASIRSEQGTVYILPEYLRTRFHGPAVHFRDRSLLALPAGTTIRTLRIRQGKNLSLRLNQLHERTDGNKKTRWKDVRGREVPSTLATRLDGMVRRLNIARFRDERGFASFPAEDLWKEADESVLTIRAELSNGEHHEIRLRNPASSVRVDGVEYALISSDAKEGSDYLEKTRFDALLEVTHRIITFLERSENSKPTPGEKTP